MPPTTPPPTPPANAERLLKLREAVVNAPQERFCMRYWNCGTSACAAGWYVLANPGCGPRFTDPYPDIATAIVPENWCGSIPNTRRTLADHFGLSIEQATCLFENWELGDAENKEYFLANLDALLAARGIAAPAGTRATEGAAS